MSTTPKLPVEEVVKNGRSSAFAAVDANGLEWPLLAISGHLSTIGTAGTF